MSDLREKFEAWLKSSGFSYSDKSKSNGVYVVPSVQLALLAYQQGVKDTKGLPEIGTYPYQKTDEYLDHVREIKQLKAENERLKKAAGLVVRMQKDFDDGNRDQLITVKDCIISLAEATKESDK